MSGDSVDLSDEEDRQAEELESSELRELVEKLHRFAKWQQAKLARREGFVSDCFTSQLQAMMKKSVQVILNKHNLLTETEKAEVAAAEEEY